MPKNLFISSIIAVLVLMGSNKAQAALVTPSFNNTDCAAVTLSSITTLTAPGANLLSQSYNASQCIGFLDRNDGPYHFDNDNPTTNIGYLGDGLLNGGVKHGQQYFTGGEFIGPGDYQDLKNPGVPVDPGWIHLTQFDAETQEWSYSTMGTGLVPLPIPQPLNIADLLTFTLNCTDGELDDCKAGTWQLKTKTNIIEDVMKLLGPATFDHLAFSIKAGSAFVVYDFNFKNIFSTENNPLLNFNTPYILAGEFNTSDLGVNKQNRPHGISHFNVMARDPIAASSIPTPATLLILGLGLVFLSARVQRTQTSKKQVA